MGNFTPQEWIKIAQCLTTIKNYAPALAKAKYQLMDLLDAVGERNEPWASNLRETVSTDYQHIGELFDTVVKNWQPILNAHKPLVPSVKPL